jgi:septum formation protein
LAQIALVPHHVVPADIDEAARAREKPRVYAARMASAKAAIVRESHPNSFVLAADTVVACGRRILPKAETVAEAAFCLDLLSGRRHQVFGAVCLIAPDGRRIERLVTTAVTFKRLERSETEFYLASGEWRGKAGAYAIQGLAGAYVRALNGSYTNVVGLPLSETYAMLAGFGFRHGLVDGDGAD